MNQISPDKLNSYEMSSHQKRLWVINPTEKQLLSYSITRIKGDIEIVRLQRALATLTATHEVTRTWFYRPVGMKFPLQVITEHSSATVAIKHVASVDETNNILFEDWLEQEIATTTADCFIQPCCHCQLYQNNDGTQYLVLALPVLCVDKTSIDLLTIELLNLYSGQQVVATERLQFLDAVDELQQQLESPLAKHLIEGYKSNAPQINSQLILSNKELFGDNVSPGINVANYRVAFNNSDKLDDFCSRHGWQKRSLLFSLWQLLLNRMSHEPVAIAVIFDGRQDSEIAQLIGSLSRAIPGCLPIENDQTLISLIALAEQQLHHQELHQEYFNWQELVNEGQPYLARYGFSLHYNSYVTFPGFEAERIRTVGISDLFDLHLSCDVTATGFYFNFYYDNTAFSSDVVKFIAARFQQQLDNALASLAHTSQILVGSLHGLSSEEAQLFIQRLTPATAEAVVPAHELFSRFAAQIPNKIALETENNSFTYAQIDRWAERLAGHLQAQGVGHEMPVAVCTNRDEYLVVSLLAILKVGAIYVPLDPQLQAQRIGYILEDTGCQWVLTVSDQRTAVTAQANVILVDQLDVGAAVFTPTVVDTGQLAYLIYTSGSTGKPKGVGISHSALFHYVHAVSQRLQLSADASLLSLASIATDLGHTALFGALLTGRTLRLLSSDKSMDADALAQQLMDNSVSSLKIVPSHLRALLSVTDPIRILPTQCLVLGGEALSAQLIEQIRVLKPDLRIINHYGPTETTVGILTHEVIKGHKGTCPVGSPLSGAQRFIVNNRGQLVGVGEVGELYLGGNALAQGYWCRPDLTADRFVPDIFSGLSGARLYRTGDLAFYRADGELVYIGRSDHQVKVRGFRVELGEIEAVLCQHPHVKESVVLLQSVMSNKTESDHASMGKELVAHIVPTEPQCLDLEAVHVFLEQHLPDYMIPVAMQPIRKLPLTGNGKIDRGALPRVDRQAVNKSTYIAPQSRTEIAFAKLWQELLGIEQVGIHDSFFILGGHSLLVTQLLSWVRKNYQISVPVKTFFDAPTIAAQAKLIDNLLSNQNGVPIIGVNIIAHSQGREVMPLSFGQERLWFTEHMNEHQGLYNTPHIWCLDGELDVGILTAAFNEIIRRHNVLRTRFLMRDGQLLQCIAPYEPLSIKTTDCAGQWDSFEQALIEGSSLVNKLHALIEQNFDLKDGPLFTICLFHIAQNKHVLLLNMHHIVSDGWSVGLFHHELSALYNAFIKGDPSPLPALDYQYVDYAIWQRTMREVGAWDNQLQYWRAQLSGLPRLKFPSVNNKLISTEINDSVSTSGCHKFYFDQSLTNGLQDIVNNHQITPFMLNLALLKLVVGYHSGQQDFAIGTSIAGRNQQETNPLIGFFINQLVLRIDSNVDMTFSHLLTLVKNTTLDAYDNQDIPFSLLVAELEPERQSGQSPFFDLLFVFQEFPELPLKIDGVNVTGWSGDKYEAKFGLTLYMGYENGLLSGNWVYNKTLIDQQSIERLTTYYQRLAAQVVSNNQVVLGDITFVTEVEQAKQAAERRKSKMEKFHKVKRS